MKEQLWPSVPDPANSSLGKWVPAALPQVRPFAAPPAHGHGRDSKDGWHRL